LQSELPRESVGGMRALPWVLLPFVLVGGAALGYAVHSGQGRTTTVVETQTRAAPSAATQKLRVVIEGPGYQCVLTSISSDTITLRRPSGDLQRGAVIALADSEAFNKSGCGWVVTFSINPQVGFFVVSDEDQQLRWGPFDSHQLAQRHWTVRVADNG
jgi:uncharacterized membrane protein